MHSVSTNPTEVRHTGMDGSIEVAAQDLCLMRMADSKLIEIAQTLVFQKRSSVPPRQPLTYVYYRVQAHKSHSYYEGKRGLATRNKQLTL